MPFPRQNSAGENESEREGLEDRAEDEEEKKAAILAQFGCKPRPAKEIVESSSSSSSEDEQEKDLEEDHFHVRTHSILVTLINLLIIYLWTHSKDDSVLQM